MLGSKQSQTNLCGMSLSKCAKGIRIKAKRHTHMRVCRHKAKVWAQSKCTRATTWDKTNGCRGDTQVWGKSTREKDKHQIISTSLEKGKAS